MLVNKSFPSGCCQLSSSGTIIDPLSGAWGLRGRAVCGKAGTVHPPSVSFSEVQSVLCQAISQTIHPESLPQTPRVLAQIYKKTPRLSKYMGEFVKSKGNAESWPQAGGSVEEASSEVNSWSGTKL